jgi:hypothetical protein
VALLLIGRFESSILKRSCILQFCGIKGGDEIRRRAPSFWNSFTLARQLLNLAEENTALCRKGTEDTTLFPNMEVGMKTMLFSWLMLLAIGIAHGQSEPVAASQNQAETQLLGRGRGGAPFAWNDRDRDGICDLTGQPVGQGRPIGYGGGRGRGRGGAPLAWNDRDGDGICDLTGRPVGQGRPSGFGRGRGFAGGRGGGRWFGAANASSTAVPGPASNQPRR